MNTRRVLQVVSWLALVATVGAPVGYLAGQLELETMKAVLLVATVVWFVAASGWIGRGRG